MNSYMNINQKIACYFKILNHFLITYLVLYPRFGKKICPIKTSTMSYMYIYIRYLAEIGI